MKKILVILFLSFFSLTIFSTNCFAGETNNPGTSDPVAAQKTVKLPNPLGDDVKDARVLIGKIINSILGVVGSLALLMFIIGGLTWMTAAGNSDRVKKGKDILIWAALGLIVVFSSYGLVRLILQAIGAV